MTDDPEGYRNELGRIRRVSDLLCTSHAGLRDRYARRALILDLGVLGLSTWLVALAFVQPQINMALTPFGVQPQLWGGLLATLTFFLTIVQLKTNWKGRADAHSQALSLYAEVKREAGYVLSSSKIDEAEYRRVLARYDIASAVGIAVPERDFLRQKHRHRLKIALSKHLDDFPAASLWLTRIRFFLRDNCGERRSDR